MKGISSECPSLNGRSGTECPTPADALAIQLPWGPDATLRLELPAELRRSEPNTFRPDLDGSMADYPAALESALGAPQKSPPLERLVKAGSTVAIVVDDPSRWTPVGTALPIILSRLHAAGVRTEEITISLGVGRHQAVDLAAMKQRLGESIVAKYRCLSPPVDDLTAYEDLGTTARGVPVRIFCPVVRADLRILIGSVLPHLQAGFGGGYKLILPGTSHRTTLGALHRQGLGGGSDAASLLGGDASSNPMRQAIQQAAELVGPCFSISHLLGGPAQIFRVICGRPEIVQEQLAAEVRRRFQAQSAGPADIVVAGNHPWPGDPMQSFKVLLHHRAACKPGGVLAGFFWTDPDEIDRSFPRSASRWIAATGAPGGWAIRSLVPLAERLAVSDWLFECLHAALGPRAGCRSHRSGFRPPTSCPAWPPPGPRPLVCRPACSLASRPGGAPQGPPCHTTGPYLPAGWTLLRAAVPMSSASEKVTQIRFSSPPTPLPPFG